MSESKKLFSSLVDAKIIVSKNKNFDKAISEYLNPNNPFNALPPEGFSPDLQYNTSILVSEGTNKNSDVFLRKMLCAIFKTPRHKLVNYEHDTHAENDLKNPNQYKVVGHIYDSALATQDGRVIPEWDIFISEIDNKWFPQDSPWRGLPLDIKVAWVLYQFEFPELAGLIMEAAVQESDTGFGVSMEILFSNYKFRIGAPIDATEDFDFDGNTLPGVIEVHKGDPLADLFQMGWNSGRYRVWNDKPVYRVLGGDIFFSGMAITGNRANTRSINLATAQKAMASITNSKISDIIKAVAAKEVKADMSVCEIVNGEPNCDCLENTIAGQIELLTKEVADIKAMVSVADYNYEEPINHLHQANKKLMQLYENNIDNELSKKEIEEFLEEIENNLQKAISKLRKHI